MNYSAEWEALFRKWIGRLMPTPDWEIRFIPDDDCPNRAEVTSQFRYREATFRYRPSDPPNELTACHEVCHLLTARAYALGRELLDTAGDRDGIGRRAFDGAIEEVVNDMARAFVRAYEGEDGTADGSAAQTTEEKTRCQS